MSDVTQILLAIERGEANAAEDLLPLVYNELRRLAAHKLSSEAPGQTLQATALVHEAWLRLAGPAQQNRSWNGRRHFFNAAAEAMRRIIDRARCKKNQRHGGTLRRVALDTADISAPVPDDELLALHDALDELDHVDPLAGELVKLRFFIGLTHAQAAEMLGLSRSGADRTWLFARAWLFDRIQMEKS